MFFDILAIQGDRIAGKETLPTMLGEKKSFRVIQRILLAETGLVLGAAAWKLFAWGPCLLLSMVPFFMLCLIYPSAKNTFLSNEGYAYLIEGSFVTVGILMAQIYYT